MKYAQEIRAINSTNSLAKRKEKIEKYEKIIKALPAAEAFATRGSVPTHDQVNFLVTAWERASQVARSEFMKLVGVWYVK